MRFPVRRVLLGFAVGSAVGWAAGLLRRPADAPPGSGADEATRLPQEEFGSPVDSEGPGEESYGTAEDVAQEPTAPAEAYDAPTGDTAADTPPPRKATAPAVKRPPGSRRTKAAAAADLAGGSEPAAGPEATEANADPAKPAKAAKPAKPRARRATKATTETVVDDAAAALRAGHAAATERLADAEAEATPPPEDPGPAARRRRPAGGA